MLAKPIAGLPDESKYGDMVFEPKWDGFRCIVFRDGDEIELGSRNERPLTRYFPEILEPLRSQLPDRCVVDGELIIVRNNELDFSALQLRLHPAESRVNKLAAEIPSSFVAFDLLALGDDDLRHRPYGERRGLLAKALADATAPLYLTPTTTDRTKAERWFEEFEGAGLDGLIAKAVDNPYVENKRTQLKVKHIRSADAVVAGYRIHKDGKGVGSLLLGLYDDQGNLHHVGVAASFTAKRRTELLDELEPLLDGAMEDHPWRDWAQAYAHQGTQMPGAPHRWNAQRDGSWVPLRIERVVEVKYGSTLGGRFREVTKVLRWRPDKQPLECDFNQLQEPIPVGVDTVLEAQG
jgi:ATP-dependent DNA ligase